MKNCYNSHCDDHDLKQKGYCRWGKRYSPDRCFGFNTMNILHLTLKKKWFDLIASGKKTVEYREYKPYWEKRLVGKNFQEIHFKNGYAKGAPFMKIKCLGIVNIMSNGPLLLPKNGEELTGWQFAILLGPILELRGS